MSIAFSIDRGGTFTDIFAQTNDGVIYTMKLLSEDIHSYHDAPTEGIKRILSKHLNSITPSSISSATLPSMVINSPIDFNSIAWIRMGTTVATNALLERKGESIALLITKGFKDLLYIGNQSRENIFDLKLEHPKLLYENVIEVNERVILKQNNSFDDEEYKNCRICTGITGEEVIITQELDENELTKNLLEIKSKGINCLAVALLHSYVHPEHEQRIERLAKSLGFHYVVISSKASPMIKLVPRGLTTCADAYLTPSIQRYISSFLKSFNQCTDLSGKTAFMQSDGGLTPIHKFTGSKAILSGPAGGVVGYALTTIDDLGNDNPIIGFDMGGTSTDVSRFEKTFEHVYESTIAGITTQVPHLDIKTVAAGGGSKLLFRSGLFVVGPESTGAFPGPACYRNGGDLSVTDANLFLGRIVPKYFPKIFGANKNERLDVEITKKKFSQLTEQINLFNKNKSNKDTQFTQEEVAIGFIKVANESMCRPIRAITQGKGFDTSKHILACFGGAGGQHACAIARSLGIKTVFIHRFASILSAFGMALASVVHEVQEPTAIKYEQENFKQIDEKITQLKVRCKDELIKQGFNEEQIIFEIYLNLRYERTDFAFMTRPLKDEKFIPDNYCFNGDFKLSFAKRYHREFGFTIPDRDILIDDIRIRGVGKHEFNITPKLPSNINEITPIDSTQCYFENIGFTNVPIYSLNQLLPEHKLSGPCLIVDENNTILIEPNCDTLITHKGNIKITIHEDEYSIEMNKLKLENECRVDPIYLSIFSHRFMSIAEEMGNVLQRTSISTNIKERLDFSCALFGPDGGLVSNAPHIPVHLGAMQEAVKYQLSNLDEPLKPGDVILSNHPCAGGSHLPDLTVITPVFYDESEEPIFFVANRGHHADIGGKTPGSMPSESVSLDEEGATFISFKLVKRGIFQEEELTEALTRPNDGVGQGTRSLNDNISDLKAQIAANNKGIKLVTSLIDYYGLKVVQAYMKHIQENAEVAVKEMLKEIAKKSTNCNLFASDSMDDGSKILLSIQIDGDEGKAVFDFTGTGYEVYANYNAPKAVTLSAIIYCLRCMVGYDIPLNQGCLNPITVKIPHGSLLWPSNTAAVVGGNVLTSQRVVDVILKAFNVVAASQGCMNNITFGDKSFGYYETVAGGAGAGPSWHGRSGVHTHMTNTRITDVEILEKRYPVIVKKFHLNENTGGKGLFNGGDGVIRELLFRRPLHLSVLTERRVFSPYGLEGGENGRCGVNLIYRKKDDRKIFIGSKKSMNLEAGDIFHLETPGGGGYGKL